MTGQFFGNNSLTKLKWKFSERKKLLEILHVLFKALLKL